MNKQTNKQYRNRFTDTEDRLMGDREGGVRGEKGEGIKNCKLLDINYSIRNIVNIL